MIQEPTARELRVMDAFMDLAAPQMVANFPDRAMLFDDWRKVRDENLERWNAELPVMIVMLRCMLAAERLTP